MSTTFSSLLTSLRLSLRDPNGTTWSDGQLGELINRGIDAISDVYQSEAIQATAFTQPVSGSVFSVDLSTVTWPVRVDVYDAISKSATITAAAGSGTTNVYTYSSLSAPVNVSAFSVGDAISVTGVSPSVFNITGTVISATSSTFQISSLKNAQITNAVADGTNITYTYGGFSTETGRSGFENGDNVAISSSTVTEFNISGQVANATQYSFTISNALSSSTTFTGRAVVSSTAVTSSYSSGGSVATTAAPKYRETVRPSSGDGPDSGWETHGGILYLPTRYTLAVGTGTLNVVGYGPWTQINTAQTSSITNLDTTAQNAVKVFVEAEALTMLTFDRAQYQQWQVSSGSSDISALGMNNLALAAQQRWRQEKNRIRRFRKGG
jgi:hypothetical protein